MVPPLRRLRSLDRSPRWARQPGRLSHPRPRSDGSRPAAGACVRRWRPSSHSRWPRSGTPTLGHGSICTDGRCGPCLDGRDLFERIGVKRSRGVAEAYRLDPSIIPSIGYTPQHGVVVGATTLAAIYFGDPTATTIRSLDWSRFTPQRTRSSSSRALPCCSPTTPGSSRGTIASSSRTQPTYGLGSKRPISIPEQEPRSGVKG